MMAHLTCLLFVLWVGVSVSTVIDLQKRIYSGKDCDEKDRLYHVSLSKKSDGKPGHCGGSLITDQWILTAAHCQTKPMYAVLNVHPGPGNAEEIDDIEHLLGVDLMLLKLKNPTKISPVALPERKDEPKIDHEVQIAGHGYYQINEKTGLKIPGDPRKLQCANMPIVDCAPTRNSPCYSDVPYENRTCYSDSKVDACQGDSGGGVIYKKMIYGVINGGGICACTRPVVSVNVSSYLNWIKQTIGLTGLNNGK